MEGEEAEAEAASAADPDAIDGTGWADDGKGELVAGKPRLKDGYARHDYACFKHSQATPTGDVWTMQVDEEGQYCMRTLDLRELISTLRGTVRRATALPPCTWV